MGRISNPPDMTPAYENSGGLEIRPTANPISYLINRLRLLNLTIISNWDAKSNLRSLPSAQALNSHPRHSSLSVCLEHTER